jgi:hypothetical protein
MYTREIPTEYKDLVRQIMLRQQTNLILSGNDKETLFGLYYRFIAKLRKGETVESRMRQDFNCSACIGKVIYYFKNAVSEWSKIS